MEWDERVMVIPSRSLLTLLTVGGCATEDGRDGVRDLDLGDGSKVETAHTGRIPSGSTTASTGDTALPIEAVEVCGHAVAPGAYVSGRRFDGTVPYADAWWQTNGVVAQGYLGFNGGVGDLDGDGHADLAIRPIEWDLGLTVYFGPFDPGSWPGGEVAAYSVVATPTDDDWRFGVTDVDLDGGAEVFFYSYTPGDHEWEILDLAPGPAGRVETTELAKHATLDFATWDAGALPFLRWSPGADFDGDGHADLWLTTYDGQIGHPFLKLLPGPLVGTRDPLLESAGAFETIVAGDTTYGPQGYPDHDVLAVGDYDGDGAPDLAYGLHGGGMGGVAWLLDPPLVTAPITDVLSSSVAASVHGRYLGMWSGAVTVPDMNGDGYDETAFGAEVHTSVGAEGGIILLQYGPPPVGTFAEECISVTITTDEADAGADEIFSGDFDGDDVPDLVAHGLETWVFYGPVPTGVMSVADADAFLPGAMPLGVADFDEDGYDDLALGNAWGGTDFAGEVYILLGGWE